jgi:hypothetical protein
LGDQRIKHRVNYDSQRYCECIYCGAVANSREHIPSKIFLEKPYPNNLLLVPSCKTCNNYFSYDELYTWFAIQILKKEYYRSIYITSETYEDRFKKHSPIIAKVHKDVESFCLSKDLNQKDDIYNFKSKRIERILWKLAVGHSVFELSECYYTGDEEWNISITYSFLPTLSLNEIDDMNASIDISNYPLPEVGSRIFEHIYVLQPKINYKCYKGFLMLDWIDIQKMKYRYTCANLGDRIVVKIVINEFLYSIITFIKNES